MSHPKTHQNVILVDGGELSDVRRLLNSLGVEYGEAASLDAVARAGGCNLLVSSARHALAGPGRPAEEPWRLHVVVYDAISDGLRRLLSRSGCDIAVGRPVHAAVMRLLVAHALYAGPERRGSGRAAMSAPVRLIGPAGTSIATLVQLSERGCGVIAPESAEVGDTVTLLLPPELTAAAQLPLEGRVMGVSAAEVGEGFQLALVFEPIDPKVAQILAAVMQRRSLGLTRSLAESGSDALATPGAGVDLQPDDRGGPRKLFSGRVVAAGGSHSRVLIGRDLSIGGMRVRPIRDLGVGDEFKLAIYGDGDTEALVLDAVVARDDGWDGLVLQFQRVSPEARLRLERVIASLPAVLPEKGADARAPGVLVSEILEGE